MFLSGGVYRWRPKTIAFRNDYCLTCRAECVAIRVRALYVVHIYWIPILPLGFLGRWECLACGQDPSVVRTARRGIKIPLAVVVTIVAALPWLDRASSTSGGGGGDLVARAVLLALAAAAWAWVANGSEDVGRRARLPHVQPSRAIECPLCEVPLMLTEPARCIQCGIVRERLPDIA